MKILVIGSGGRENAIVWKLAQSPLKPEIYCCPGNPGMLEYAKCIPEGINLVDFAMENEINLTVVGPELPLCNGIVDEFKSRGLRIFGPPKEAAKLEGSKIFAKIFMCQNEIPTASFNTFSDFDKAVKYLCQHYKSKPCVVKVDGLAAGKGVYVCKSYIFGMQALKEILIEHKFGYERVVIEEYIEGFEVSCMMFLDGHSMIPMPMARDYKRLSSDKWAPNTGGMLSYAPHELVTPDIADKIINNIIVPTRDGLNSREINYSGVLYAGIMVDKDNEPHLLEYNVRFGDPETQAVLMLLESDLVEILDACMAGELYKIKEGEWSRDSAVCRVAASEGYPVRYERGYEIKGLDSIDQNESLQIFHAGTKIIRSKKFTSEGRGPNKLVTDGGRVLGVTVKAPNLGKAMGYSEEMIKRINFKDKYYRRDI